MLDDLKLWEGCTDFMYLDTVGIVTVGYGFAMPAIEGLKEYAWSRSLADAQADWRIVSALPKGRRASFYAPYTRSRMLRADESAEVKLAGLVKLLERPYTYSIHPDAAKRALLDMAWNLGMGGLRKYKQLGEALARRDYASCASECHRRGVSDARNKWTADLFDSCK